MISHCLCPATQGCLVGGGHCGTRLFQLKSNKNGHVFVLGWFWWKLMMYVFLKILLYPMFWKMSIAERETWHHIQTIQFIYRESGLGKITNTHPPGGTAVQRFLPCRCNLSRLAYPQIFWWMNLWEENNTDPKYPKTGPFIVKYVFFEFFSESVLKVFF